MRCLTPMMLATLLCPSLVACDGCSKPQESGCVSSVDADGDGWDLCDDCADDDPTVHPEALDCLNEVDDDCDGVVDPEGAPEQGTWRPDADGDGYGDHASTLQACEQPEGSTEDASDCDDSDAEIHPGATEWCNGEDDDCDGFVDEDAEDMGSWYVDADGDGWGQDGSETVACEPESGTADQGGDCDDDDPDAHPDALPGCDGRDLDCDGAIDNDNDLDSYSDEGCGGTDCDDGDDSVYPLAPEVCGDGVVNDCEGSVAEASALCWEDVDLAGSDAIIQGEEASQRAGGAVAGRGDVNGDGLGDILVGAYGVGDDLVGEYAGAAFLFHGPITGTHGVSEAYAAIHGEQEYATVGGTVAMAGDADADGFGDILVSSGRWGDEQKEAVFLFYGPISGDYTVSSADAWFTNDTGSYGLSAVSWAGDVDGDGEDDLLWGEDGGPTNWGEGAAYLMFGPLEGERAWSTSDLVFIGDNRGDFVGASASGVGDVDGDGLADLLIGAPGYDSPGEQTGAAALLLGPAMGNLTLSDADALLCGVSSNDWAGAAVAGAGDLNQDGLDDLLIGAHQSGTGTAPGGAYAVLALPTGTTSLSDAEIELIGAAGGDYTGWAVDGAGDADGDGRDDILIGAFAAETGPDARGVSYLVLAPEPGTWLLAESSIRLIDTGGLGNAGYALAGAGDTNDDGLDELLIGAYSADSHGSNSGAACLYTLELAY